MIQVYCINNGVTKEFNEGMTLLEMLPEFEFEKPYPIVSALYADIGEADRETVERLIRFVRQTSDHAGGEDGSEPVNSLCASFSADGGLAARIRTCLHGEPLREGFFRMLEKNGLNGDDLRPETLEELCCGHREWKWIWQEESVIHAIQKNAY